MDFVLFFEMNSKRWNKNKKIESGRNGRNNEKSIAVDSDQMTKE